MSQEETALSISIIALVTMFVITITQLILKVYSIKKSRDMMLDEAEMLCRDLKRILTDCDKNNEEELYEIDLSLTSYFKDNSLKLESLADRLSKSQVWYYKNPILEQIGELLEWLLRDFYDGVSEEEERIRVWSQNIPKFHSKYLKSFS